MPHTDARTAGGALGVSVGVVLLLSCAMVVSGAPLATTTEAVDGVHMQAEYIEGSSIEISQDVGAVDGCNETMTVTMEDATVSGVTLYAELPETSPVAGGGEVGFRLDADEYEVGSLQMLVSELGSEGDIELGGTLSSDAGGFSLSGDDFRLEDVETRVYGFGSAWFDAPFVRADVGPDEDVVERYRC